MQQQDAWAITKDAIENEQEFDGARINAARIMEKMTQATLSLNTSIPQSKLSKIQNGIVQASLQDIQRIAAALDYPITFFSKKVSSIPASNLTYRKKASSSMKEMHALSFEYSELCEVIDMLRTDLNLADRSSWIGNIAPHEETVMTASKIDKIAAAARYHMNLPQLGAVPNVTRALERCGIVVAPLYTPFGNTDDLAESEGVCYPSSSSKTVCIGYVQKKSISGDRLRFTKAHELGHLILHKYRTPATPQQMEREANLFAGSFLLPFDDLKASITPDATLSAFVLVKAGWGISIAAAIQRAHATGVLSAARYKSLQIQRSSRGWRTNEPVQVDPETPLLFKQMVEARFGINSSKSVLDRPVNAQEASIVTGIPFRYIDYWANGLTEDGSELGFKERRFS